jgi:hypothetical protein
MKDHETTRVLAFAAASFRSAWTVELLCLLQAEPERTWPFADIVTAMRASELVVQQGVDALVGAGLVVLDAAGVVHYVPPASLEETVEQVIRVYKSAPDKVRRAIVRANSPSMVAFADAFRLREK